MNEYNLEKIEKYCEKLYYFEEIDSTNKTALDTKNAPNGSLFLAKKQTNGRGRLGREWIYDDGGIYMTILLKQKKIPDEFSAITLVCALAAARVIKNSKIKWPNDIVLDNKKVCGILAESEFLGDKSAKTAVGIGVNANNKAFPKKLSDKATSLYLQNGKKQNKAEIVTAILKEFWELYENFCKLGFDSIRDEYLEKSATVGREITVIKNGNAVIGTAVGITNSGELEAVIDGKKEVLNAGEVSVRGLLGYN